MNKYIPRARVTMGDEMSVIGTVEIDENTSQVTIVKEKDGKEVITHLSQCIIKEL